MKLPSVLCFRPLAGAGVLFTLLIFSPMMITNIHAAGTNAPATNAPAAKAPVAKAPPAAPVEMDKESGKPIVTTPSGLKYIDLAPGGGPAAKTGDHLSVNYTGKLIDGSKFDSSYDRGQPFDLDLGRTSLIQGWTEGLVGMKAGGKRKLIIPPQLGYGLSGFDVIPPNATLIFEVELVAVTPPAPASTK